jgi:hypothetical protein
LIHNSLITKTRMMLIATRRARFHCFKILILCRWWGLLKTLQSTCAIILRILLLLLPKSFIRFLVHAWCYVRSICSSCSIRFVP